MRVSCFLNLQIDFILIIFILLSYETADGKLRNETGIFKDNDGNDVFLYVRGYYSYYQPNGLRRDVFYEADQNGYREVANVTQGDIDTFIEPRLIPSLIG